MATTIKLSEPLLTHDGAKEELTLRDLRAKDMVKMRTAPMYFINLGDNSQVDVSNKRADQRFEIRYDIAMHYLSALSGVDEILLGELPARDMNVAVNAVCAMWNVAQGE